MPFGDEVQTITTHHTHSHTLTPYTPHPTHTRSQHKRSLRSRDARQRRAKQRIQNRATHGRNYRSWRSALTSTPSIVPSQGTGSLGQPHRQKPLYDLTGRTLSHRRLQQQRSKQQQQHPATPSLPTTVNNIHRRHRCHRFRRFLQNLFKLKRKPPQNNSTPNHLRTDTSPAHIADNSGKTDTTPGTDNIPEHTGSKPTLPIPARRAEPSTTCKPPHNSSFEELSGTPPGC